MKQVLKPELKLGAEPKKVAALAILLAVAGIVYFMNREPEQGPAQSAAVRPPAPLNQIPATGPRPSTQSSSRPGARPAGRGGRDPSAQDFHPTLKPKDGIDPSRIDPTLRLDRLARLKSVRAEGGSRSLFDFSGAPQLAANTPIPKVPAIKVGPLQAALTIGPNKPAPPSPPGPKAADPPAPPIPLKFYGYTNAQRSGPKRALFLEGEDIFVGAEGDMIKGRYKIVRIGVNSAVVEDTGYKNNQQTLPLVEEVAST